MTLEFICWIATIVALAGTVLNVLKRRMCFALWSLTNVAWLGVDIYNRMYSRAILDFVQLALAIWGLFAWKEESSRI